MEYLPRILDDTLATLLNGLPAVAIEGAKGVGKTETANRFAKTVFELDRVATKGDLANNPDLALVGERPILIDEWQLVPPVWDVVRRAVDRGAEPGSFILTGSADLPPGVRTHSGAGRIVSLLMRPLSLPERRLGATSVSLAGLLSGGRDDVAGTTPISSADYVQEILASGFPAVRKAPREFRHRLLDGYLETIVTKDIPEAGGSVRRPDALRHWLAAYGAATATTASYATVLDAATPGDAEKPSKPTALAYRDLLSRVRVLDPLPAWIPGFAHLKRLTQSPKHHLVDPALAARLVGATFESLIGGRDELAFPRDGTFLGALFESLAVQTIRVLADACEAKVFHFRTLENRQEVDIIVQRPDLRVLAIEVKFSQQVRPADVASLNWLETQIPDLVVDKVVLNTSDRAYRRKDGVAVVPLALLGR